MLYLGGLPMTARRWGKLGLGALACVACYVVAGLALWGFWGLVQVGPVQMFYHALGPNNR